MKKFVIKNRRKRKYVKKREKASIYTFSKTLYGVLPFLIMSVAFMATVVISTSFRHSLSHINFKAHIQLPSFSLANPLLFFQTLLFDVTQMTSVCGEILSLLWTGTVGVMVLIVTAISRIIVSLNPLPVVETVSHTTAQGVGSTNETITNTGGTLAGMLLALRTIISTSILLAISYIIHICSTTEILLMTISTNSLRITVQLVASGVQICLTALLFIFGILSFVWYWFSFFMTSVGHAIDNFIHQVISLIEIPFKTLAAFGLLMMPYINFFGHHLSQTGMDFKNAVKSFNNAASAISTYKRT